MLGIANVTFLFSKSTKNHLKNKWPFIALLAMVNGHKKFTFLTGNLSVVFLGVMNQDPQKNFT